MFRRSLSLAGLAVLLVASQGAAQVPRVAEVQIAPPFVRMVPDAQVQASATAYDSAGTPVVVRFRWMSSNINVATVSENGVVRGIAPGTALITAAYEGQRGGRRRAMQVQVMTRGSSPSGVSVTALPPGAPALPPPGMPPATPLPSAPPTGVMPPSPPTVTYTTSHAVDSMVKASINCNEPMLNAANPLQACYDQRPTPRVPSATTLTPCADQPNTNGVMVMVKVTEAGVVTDVMPFIRHSCPQLIEAAIAAARAMTFNPALREGRPVTAWTRLTLRTTEPPPKQ